MKKNLLLSILCVFAAISTQAQVFYTQDFESTALFGKPTGWTSKVFNVYPSRGVANSKAIQSVFGASANFDSLGSAILTMPSAPFVPAPMVLNFQYRICDYIGASPIAGPIPAGSKLEVFIQIVGRPNVLVKTISQSPNSAAYQASGEIVLGNDYYGQDLKLIFKMTNAGGSGTSYTVQLDDITLGIQSTTATANAEKTASSKMAITPNPAQNGVVNLRFEGASEGAATINIMDITGKLLTTKNIEIANNQLFTIETPFAAGIYFITANTASGKFTERIVLN